MRPVNAIRILHVGMRDDRGDVRLSRRPEFVVPLVVVLDVLTTYIAVAIDGLSCSEESSAMRATCRTLLPSTFLGRTQPDKLSFPRNEGVRGSNPRVGFTICSTGSNSSLSTFRMSLLQKRFSVCPRGRFRRS